MRRVRSADVCLVGAEGASVIAVEADDVGDVEAVVTTKEVSACTTSARALSGSDSAVDVATKWRRRGRR